MLEIRVRECYLLYCIIVFVIVVPCYSYERLFDGKSLYAGKELWKETMPLQSGSRVYRLEGLKSNSWYEVKISYPASIPAVFSLELLKNGVMGLKLNHMRRLLNTEKLVFKTQSLEEANNADGLYVLVTVEPEGIVAIPNFKERSSIIYNIVCEEQLLGIPYSSCLGFIGEQWIVGIIDEVRKVSTAEESSESGPVLSDTKTRVRDTLPAEPQRRNGRLQVMLYKLLWDTVLKEGFPAGRFFNYFSLDRHFILSQDVRDNIANAGIPAQTLEDIVRYYENTFKMLPVANDQLLLRYEFQKDQCIIAEIRFNHDHEWVMRKYRELIEFWRNEREAEYTPEEERWKCRFCQFARSCAGNPSLESTGPSSQPSETPPLSG